MIQKLLHARSAGIGSAALILGVSALASRVLAVFRDRLLAGTFGAGQELDIYFAAFRVPDFLYAILVLWGASAVFLPLFSKYMEESKEKAWRFACNLLNAYILAFGAIAVIAALIMPVLVDLAVPGFSLEAKEAAVALSRVMLLSPLVFAVSSVAAGVLQYSRKFIAVALAPVLYNAGIIAGVVFFVPVFGIMGLAYGVVFGALLHACIHLPSLISSGFRWRPLFLPVEEGVKRAFLLSIPRTIGGGAHHINLIVMTAFASVLPAGSIAAFSFAENLQAFAIGSVGVPFALSAFSVLSQSAARQDMRAFHAAFSGTFFRVLLLTLPFALAAFFFKDVIVRLVLFSGSFSREDAALVAGILGIFAAGMMFQSVVPLLVRAFFAVQNTVIPTIAGVLCALLNIALVFVFLRAGLGVFGLPLALVISGATQMVLLLSLFFLLFGSHSLLKPHAR
ncbi:MAG: murein biosynthesis integral membrane protein MurJ [Candidatus Wildermuthbacteria bacterium]|nr:murein biosynthesis integral membrane protein MurJ [Candidatus Wildermuthbacteria bacterium]